MPWYGRYRYRWRRPYYRRRGYWPRRSRFAFRRRWRRRRVRRNFFHKKLKTLKIREWQPRSIRKCKVTGMINLLQVNPKRMGNNFTLYEDSIVPEHLPSGGGFSLMKFTFNTLYSYHKYVRNWWTKGNKELPLLRYNGCKFRLYQAGNVDYVFRYINAYPMTSTQLMYASMQPSLLMMLSHSIIVPSKKTEKRKKPYKTVRIRPPSQMMTKWYFQHEILNTGLVLTQTSACSLDNYFIATEAENNNINIITLNTILFQNRQFHTNPNEGYHCRTTGTLKRYLFATQSTAPIQQVKLKDVIFLGNTRDYVAGHTPIKTELSTSWTNGPPKTHWGNPFHADYMSGDYRILYKDDSLSTIYAGFTQHTFDTQTANMTELSSTFTWTLRYNPNKDDGSTNSVYLVQNHTGPENWEPTNKTELLFEGYPLWILLWGYTDFQKRLAAVSQIDTHWIVVIKTKATSPQADFIVPLDHNFTIGKSPYQNELDPYDRDKWYPMEQYQTQQITDILKCGPGTPKLTFYNNADVHAKYDFYFKFGGNPPQMEEVINPEKQPFYPTPSNFFQKPSLQNPATPSQYFLSNFDQRREMLTETASKRIKKHFSTTDSIFTDQARMRMDVSPQKQTPQTSEDETSSEEEKEETLFQQLQQQRLKQKRIRHRILRLLTQMQNLE
nr:MAG: ORF1 [TTV-like mini virus]